MWPVAALRHVRSGEHHLPFILRVRLHREAGFSYPFAPCRIEEVLFNYKLQDLGDARHDVGYNRISDIGYAGHCDCGGVQTRWSAMSNLQHHHNWIYRMPILKATRFDTSGEGGDVWQNVGFDTKKGFMMKGGEMRGNLFVHNTLFSNGICDISFPEVEYGSGSTNPGMWFNDRSKVFNNFGDDWKDQGWRQPKVQGGKCVAED
eukprot:gene6606-67233_t